MGNARGGFSCGGIPDTHADAHTNSGSARLCARKLCGAEVASDGGNVTIYRCTESGDLNVIIVGWNDSTTQVSSLTDLSGNVYQLAVGPTVLTGSVSLSQAIYYAKNILPSTAGANKVTVRFNAAALGSDIRILEYSGIDPVSPLDGVRPG